MPLPPDPQDDEVRPSGEADEEAREPEGEDPVEVAAGTSRGDVADGADAAAGTIVGIGIDLGPIDRPPPATPAQVPHRPPRSPAYNTPQSAAYTGAPVPASTTPGTSGLAAATAAAAAATAAATAGGDPPGEGPGYDTATTVLGPRRDHNRLRWTLAAVVALVVGAGAAVAISGGDETGTGTEAAPVTVAPDAMAGGANLPGVGAPTTGPTATTAPATGPGSPVAAMEVYLRAISERDCQTMVSMVTVASLPSGPDPRTAAVNACKEGFSTGSTGLNGATFGKVRLVSQTTDRAIVSFEQTVGGTTSSQTIVLRRRDGRWLLSLNR
jgi:hypothetical protein